MDRNKKRKLQEEEEEELSRAIRVIEEDHMGTFGNPVGKAFVRGDIVENSKKVGDAKRELYKPEPSISLKPALPSTASSFEEAKRLAAAKARLMMEAAQKEKGGPPPVVIPPSTAKPVARPQRPGANKAAKNRTSNLDEFKEELKRVQEERDKRKGLRDHLRNELGVDAASVDRIAPALDKPYGSGEFDDDPYTTNLYISNLPHEVVMEDMFDTFGSFGPLASAKILYPRTEEEKRREHLCGFVAYMNRTDADRAVAALQHGLEIRGEPVKIAFARPVVIPPAPFYVPPCLEQLAVPDPATGLPFNAKPLTKDAEEFLKKYEKFPALGPGQPLLSDLPEEQRNDYVEMIKNATVRVVIPTESNLLQLIHRVVEFVVREGPIFEAMLMGKEQHNPMYRFLFDYHHPAHVYYRWKLFSVMQGDTLDNWRMIKFRMFVGGSWWQPPPPMGKLFSAMPPFLYKMSCDFTDREKWFPTLCNKEKHTKSDKSPRRPPIERKKIRKNVLSRKERNELEDLLRNMTPEKDKIGDGMLWCAEHATHALEICETIYESLTLDETPLHKKIARIYLVSDILANCAQRGVRDIFFYRQHFEQLLPKIFAALHDSHQKIEARLKSEQFKQRIMMCFRAWEDASLYSKEFLIYNQNVFLGLERLGTSSSEPSDEEDIDGKPLEDEEDIDGVPLEEVLPVKEKIFDVDSDEEKQEPPKKKPAFKSAGWDEVPIEKPTSKWEAMESGKWDEDEKEKSQEKDERPSIVAYAAGGSSDSDGEIDDKDSPSQVAAKAAYEEEKRRLLRDVEGKIMAFQDDLECDNATDIKSKVDDYRKKQMDVVKKKLEEFTKKENNRDKKKEKNKKKDKDKERKEKEERSHDRSRDRDRSREREREREKERERERERERDRDRDRRRERDRSRERDRDRRDTRERSRDRDRRDRERRRSTSRDRDRRRDRDRSPERRRR